MKGAGSIVSIDDTASLDDLTLGLDWTQWLLRSVRQRCAGVILPEQSVLSDLRKVWPIWLRERFGNDLGPALLACAEAIQTNSLAALRAGEKRWSCSLSESEAERSIQAGSQLLKSVRGARHAGSLFLVQEAYASRTIMGHIGLIWPAVASLFQLSPAMMLAEYLRLELHCAGRQIAGMKEEAAFTRPMVKCVQDLLAEQNLTWRDRSEAIDTSV